VSVSRLLKLYRCALLCWLALLELWADLAQWRGLRWGGAPLRGGLLAVLLRCAGHMRLAGTGGTATLLLAFPLALAAQLALASLRNWRLDPRRRLCPGTWQDRRVTCLSIPTQDGAVPAVHIVPAGGAQAAVCYLHGSGSNKYAYTWGITDALLARGLAVLLVDLDGHGESPQVQAFPQIAGSAACPLVWLREHYARVGVIGTSLGGCIAARAVADGARVDALALLEAPLRLRLTRRQMYLEAWRLLRPVVLRLLREGSPYHLAHTWITSPPIRARIGTQQLIAALDLPGSLRRIGEQGVPLLAVYAGRDAIVPREQARQVQQALPPGAAFHLLPEASHLSLVVDPRMYWLVSEWLHQKLHT
jgi:alpha-beta hydrolase superfamily lysophospholipase